MSDPTHDDFAHGRIHVYEPVPRFKFHEPDLTLAMQRTGLRLADQAVVADIETHTGPLVLDSLGTGWRDITPMLSEHEQPPQFIDMNAEALAWAIARGLVLQHPTHAHLVRIVRRP